MKCDGFRGLSTIYDVFRRNFDDLCRFSWDLRGFVSFFVDFERFVALFVIFSRMCDVFRGFSTMFDCFRGFSSIFIYVLYIRGWKKKVS